MLKSTLLVIAAALAVLLAYAATRPDTFRVERSLRIQAPPERLHAMINDLRSFNTWNPYERKDPAIKGSYGATTVGRGASYGWESNEVGTGSLAILETVPASKVTMALDFVKPFEAHNQAEFTLQPEQGGTRVTWAMHGPVPYLGKVMHVFINVDRMVGTDFEAGLANLKTLAEKNT
ncbi:SRPBCC family protein [Rhizobacter sp. P5_C2]